MEYKTSENESIVRFTENGECKQAVRHMNKGSIRAMPPECVSRLLFALIPLKTKAAKEETGLLLKYGVWDWKAEDEEHVPLYVRMLENDRVDMVSEAARNLKKRDARDTELSSVWVEVLSFLFMKQQSVAVTVMLRRGVLSSMNDEQLGGIWQEIFDYRSIELLDYMKKRAGRIPGEYITAPADMSQRRFIRQVMKKYGKNIGIPADSKELWTAALVCDEGGMIRRLMKNTHDLQYLARMASGGNEAFEVLQSVHPRHLPDDVKREVLYGVLESEFWRDRFEILARRGWRKSSQNKKEEICLADVYMKIVDNRHYTTDKKGHLQRINDSARVRFIKSFEREQKLLSK